MENRRIKSGLILLGVFFSKVSFGQSDAGFLDDTFVRDGKYYVAVLIISIIFAVIATYLFILDRKISKLEKELKNED